MDQVQCKVWGVVLTLLILQVLSTSQLPEALFPGKSAGETGLTVKQVDLQEVSSSINGDELTHRKRRLLPLLAGLGVGFGASLLAIHEIKKHFPCVGYHVGITANGKMKRTIRANNRCNKQYQKVKDSIQSKCPNVMKAECTKIGGRTRCAVIAGDGTITRLTKCV